MPKNKVLFNPASVACWLATAALILVLTSTVIESADYATGRNSVFLHKLVKLFYVELELNIPAFFSMLLLLAASLLLAVIAVLSKRQTNSRAAQWAILSAGFLLMAFDEIVAVHERLIEPMREILGADSLGIFYFAWVVPAVGLVLLLALYFLRFLRSLPPKTRFFFLLAATLYLGAAIGFELIEGWHVERHGKDNPIYIVLTTLEESLEMAGVIVFIRALLGYIADAYGRIEVRFGGPHGDDRHQEIHYRKTPQGWA